MSESSNGFGPAGTEVIGLATGPNLDRVITRFIAALALVMVASLALAGPASSHSEVRFRAPGDNQIVGGDVDNVDIQYWTPVETATITITGPGDIEIVVSETEVTGRGFLASVKFDSLTKDGVYKVKHVEISVDGDEQIGEFQFAYEAASEVVATDLVPTDSGPNWLLLAGIGVIVLGAAGLLIPRRR